MGAFTAATMAILTHPKSTRYIFAAVAAVVVTSTLYSLQVLDGPRSSGLIPWPQSPATQPSDTLPTPTPAGPEWDDRAVQVKEAFLHAYNSYLEHAAGYDELLPLSKGGVNNFNGWNVTIVDSLDTMLLMGLHDEFAAALPIVQRGDYREVQHNRFGRSAPFFETVIRYLGGLLSAYALSDERILFDKADYLATLLEPAFKTIKGFPVFAINPTTNDTIGGSAGVFAEVASCQVEWTYLAHATSSKQHFDVGYNVVESLGEAMRARKGGMFPTQWSVDHGQPVGDALTVGAAADSAHEYLLKQYLLTGKEDIASLQMYLLMTNEVLTRLMYITPTRQMVYVTEVNGANYTPSHHFEHLSCFFPGLLALGAHTLPLDLSVLDPAQLNAEAQRQYRVLSQYNLRDLHLAAADALATSCYLLYADQPSGLGSEVVDMRPQSTLWIDALEEWRKRGEVGPMPGLGKIASVPYTKSDNDKVPSEPWDYVIRRAEYFLRPETIESIYIMFKVTGDPIWRERGWEIFQSIERETRSSVGYTSLRSVTQSPAPKQDDQPSYFLAETLKYLYLLFLDKDPVPLDKWVFNTEAHPLPVFKWTEWEKHKFDIP